MKHCMKTALTLLLTLALTLGALPAQVLAESLYIIPDSDTRKLTREELWNYQYDTLLYAFNEIYARHGYKFETGSRCYNWFTLMPWYHPNASESATNHHETYAACSAIENYNVDLIKAVRKEMRDAKTLNPKGIGMPKPPARNVNKPRGFEFVSLRANQKLPVYTAPSTSAFRANNGKALVNTSGAVYAMGWENGFLLMLYEANAAGQYRVGYITGIKGQLPDLPLLGWERSSRKVISSVSLTDDPALTANPIGRIPVGATVTYLTTMFNDQAWDYVETVIDGKVARGFIPAGYLEGDFSGDDVG